jgi:hypothetical protein
MDNRDKQGEYVFERINRCATMEHHWRLVRKDPEYRWRSRQIEREIQDWIRLYGGAGLRTGIIRIPVVVAKANLLTPLSTCICSPGASTNDNATERTDAAVSCRQ